MARFEEFGWKNNCLNENIIQYMWVRNWQKMVKIYTGNILSQAIKYIEKSKEHSTSRREKKDFVNERKERSWKRCGEMKGCKDSGDEQ